jgi:hypothetical protein
MRFPRRAASLACATFWITALAGCAKDVRPNYAPPDLAASEAAVLKADTNLWISEVDGAKVDLPGVSLAIQPGNTVKVAPGDRTIVVSTIQSNTLVAFGGGGGGGNFNRFTYTFRAGHTYKVAGAGAFKKGVKVIDTQTGTQATVGG